MPLVSVVIPVYNSEQTLRETIESVLQQTHTNLEVIVINDGSQDSTLEILDRIDDTRLKVFSFQNAGLAASRNRGIQKAAGDYISFIDADDLWTPNKLASQLEALHRHPDAAVAYSWTDLIDRTGRWLRSGGHTTVNGNVYARILTVNFLENGSNALIRTQAISTVGQFDESLPAAEDWEFYIRLAKYHQFVAVPRAQILYRVSSASMTMNVERQKTAMLAVIDRAFSNAPESLQYLKRYSIANACKYLTYKALEGIPTRDRARIAAQLFWQALYYDPSLWTKRVFSKVLLKAIAVTLLPDRLRQIVLERQSKLFDLHALLVHIQTELPTQ